MITQAMIKKTTVSGLAVLATALPSSTWANNEPLSAENLSELQTPALTHSEYNAIDYRHMALYQLKQSRYYNPPSTNQFNDGQTTHIKHTHHHDHWGMGWGYYGGGWGYGSSYDRNNNASFGDMVGEGLTTVAVVATVAAVAAGAAYVGSQALYTLWPYVGAASLTAIELPQDSPWKITGYKIANGSVIRQQDFEGNEDALDAVTGFSMFDRQDNPEGRFLLIDQENWWGLVDYPVDIDVTFSRTKEDSDSSEKITVNFQRSITNGLKPGTIKSRILTVRESQNKRKPYRLAATPKYPNWVNFTQWYHQPTRVHVDFKEIGL